MNSIEHFFEDHTKLSNSQVEDVVISILNKLYKTKAFDVNIDNQYFDTAQKINTKYRCMVHKNSRFPVYLDRIRIFEVPS